MTDSNAPDRPTLTNRVRAILAASGLSPAREIPMFGGLAFMVDEKVLVSAHPDDSLLVRADPQRDDELRTRPGARQAEMGKGRSMGPSWIRVGPEALADDDDLSYWIEVAREFHAR